LKNFGIPIKVANVYRFVKFQIPINIQIVFARRTAGLGEFDFSLNRPK